MGLTEIAAMRGVLKGAKRGVQSAMQVIQVLNEKERIAAEKAEKDLARRNKIFAEGVGKLDPQGVEELQSNLGIPDHLAKESRHLFGQDIEKGNDLVGLQRFLTSTDVRLKPMAVPGFPQEGETQEVTPEMKAQALAGAQGITENQRQFLDKAYLGGGEEGITLIPEAADWAGAPRDKKFPHNKAMEINASWRRFAKSSGSTSKVKDVLKGQIKNVDMLIKQHEDKRKNIQKEMDKFEIEPENIKIMNKVIIATQERLKKLRGLKETLNTRTESMDSKTFEKMVQSIYGRESNQKTETKKDPLGIR